MRETCRTSLSFFLLIRFDSSTQRMCEIFVRKESPLQLSNLLAPPQNPYPPVSSNEANRTISLRIYILSRPFFSAYSKRRFIALSLHEWINADPLLKDSVANGLATAWLATARTFFEKCIDAITKQVFTSFHSRFIRYS